MSQRQVTEAAAQSETTNPDYGDDDAVLRAIGPAGSRTGLLQRSRSDVHRALRSKLLHVSQVLYDDVDGLILSAYRSDLGLALSTFLLDVARSRPSASQGALFSSPGRSGSGQGISGRDAAVQRAIAGHEAGTIRAAANRAASRARRERQGR